MRRFHATSAAGVLICRSESVVPAVSPTRGSGLGALVDMSIDGAGAMAADVEDVDEEVEHAAMAISPAARHSVRSNLSMGFLMVG
jgi:hypothetical protein